MALFERGETYVNRTTIKTRLNVYEDPSTISISIVNPCGTEVLAYTAMSKVTTGIYDYHYDISATAPYGLYEVYVKAISSGVTISISRDSFVLLPWNICDNIRAQTGISSTKSIDDDALASIAWDAYNEVLDDIYEFYHDEKLGCTGGIARSSGCCSSDVVDGVNTTFHTQHRPIADHDGDGTVTGDSATACEPDITGYWIDSTCSCYTAYVTVVSSECGILTVTKTDGTAIPSTAKGVYLSYWVEPESFNIKLLRKATTYLAAYEIADRFGELTRATQADLNPTQNDAYRTPPAKRFLMRYKKIRSMIGTPLMGGTR